MEERILCMYHDLFEPMLTDRIRDKAKKLGFSPYIFDFREPGAKEAAFAVFPKAEIFYGYSHEALRACTDRLKWFACMRAGVEDFVAAPEDFPNPDVIMTNSNVYGRTISEHVIMVLLMLFRRIPEYQELLAEHRWKRNLPIRGIVGSTFVVLGTGNLGTNIAMRLRGMDAGRIIGVNRSGEFKGGDDPFTEIRPIGELREVLPEAETLILAIPHLSDTQHLLNEETIALLPDGAYVVNVGRGSAIDQSALIRALESGKLAGAALDVMEQEPIPEGDPLWTAKNVILTPHVSGDNSLLYTRELNVSRFLEDLERYANGEPLRGFVDRKKGY